MTHHHVHAKLIYKYVRNMLYQTLFLVNGSPKMSKVSVFFKYASVDEY